MYTLTYYLAVADNPALHSIFPNFYVYAIVFTIIGFPLLAIVGYAHMRRSKAYSSEMDVVVESNPYSYRLSPGIQRECMAPLYLELLRLGRKSLSGERITEEELKQLQELEFKLDLIAKGGSLPIQKGEPNKAKETNDLDNSIARATIIQDTKKEVD